MTQTDPPILPADAFWTGPEPIPPAPLVPAEAQPALEKLGPSPFPKSGFPFLGFLATVYDHVATQVATATCGPDSVPEARETAVAAPSEPAAPASTDAPAEPAPVQRNYVFIPR